MTIKVRTISPSAVGKDSRGGYYSLLSYAHVKQSHIQGFDHVTFSKGESQRLILVAK